MAARTRPPFRADHVGSLLRPAALKEARQLHAEGALDAHGLREIEDREIERVIARQEAIGLQCVTDGEFRRSWWHLDFLWGLDGVEKHASSAGVAFKGAVSRAEGVRIAGRVRYVPHPMLEHFRFLAARTRRTPKMTLPAPSAVCGRPHRPPI